MFPSFAILPHSWFQRCRVLPFALGSCVVSAKDTISRGKVRSPTLPPPKRIRQRCLLTILDRPRRHRLHRRLIQ